LTIYGLAKTAVWSYEQPLPAMAEIAFHPGRMGQD